MSRGTDATVTTPFRSATPRPVWLIDLATGGSPANLRLTSYDESITWNALTFSPWPLDVSEISVEQQSETGNVTVVLGDADGTLSGYIESGLFRGGQDVSLIRTDIGATGGAGAYSIRDDFLLESWERIEGAIRLNLRPLLAVLAVEIPLRTINRNDYPGLPPSDFV